VLGQAVGGTETVPGTLVVVAGNALYVTVAVAVVARTYTALQAVETAESSGPDLTAQPPFDDDEDWS
jgi:hypothetical protein